MRRLIVVGVLALPSLVTGHHSTSEYDSSVVTEIEGTVVKVFWRNPHVVVHVESEESGEKVVWKLEGSSLSSQRRRGLREDMIAVGAQVRAAGSASMRRPANMIVDNILLPNGQELLMRNASQARWSGSNVFAFKEGIDAETAAAARAQGIFRVWSWGRLSPGWWFFGPNDKFALTDAAEAQAATWNEFTDNPQLDCVAPGMPPTMGNPYPIEFKQVGDSIELHQEEFDVVRTIHLNPSPAADIAPSPLGYSQGRWENDTTLLITTNNIDWTYFNRVGVEQTENVEVWERFVVDDKAGHLNYTIRVSDPEVLTEPYEYDALWTWVPGEVVSKYDCTTEGE